MQPSIAKLRLRLETAVCPSAPTSTLTVEGLCERFMEHARTYYGHTSGRSHFTNFRESLNPARMIYGDIPVDDFGPVQFRAVRKWMLEQDWCRSTVNGRMRRCRQCWRWGVSFGWIKPETLKALEAVRGLRLSQDGVRETDPVKPVPMEWVRATLACARPPIADMSNSQLLMGCRPGELCAMRGVDLDTSEITWTYTPASHKCQRFGKQRIILIGPKARAIIEPRLTPGYIFTTPAGKPYRVLSYNQAIRRAAERAGVPHWSVNQLRHNAATLLRRDFGLDVASVVLGHSKPDTTLIYAERNTQAARAAIAQVG